MDHLDPKSRAISSDCQVFELFKGKLPAHPTSGLYVLSLSLDCGQIRKLSFEVDLRPCPFHGRIVEAALIKNGVVRSIADSDLEDSLALDLGFSKTESSVKLHVSMLCCSSSSFGAIERLENAPPGLQNVADLSAHASAVEGEVPKMVLGGKDRPTSALVLDPSLLLDHAASHEEGDDCLLTKLTVSLNVSPYLDTARYRFQVFVYRNDPTTLEKQLLLQALTRSALLIKKPPVDKGIPRVRSIESKPLLQSLENVPPKLQPNAKRPPTPESDPLGQTVLSSPDDKPTRKSAPRPQSKKRAFNPVLGKDHSKTQNYQALLSSGKSMYKPNANSRRAHLFQPKHYAIKRESINVVV